jgi:hypothetical protein
MENPSDRVQELQDIQFQLIAFIQKYTADKDEDSLTYTLKKAITELNDAKGIILDRAAAAGTLRMVDSSDGSHLKQHPAKDAKAS